MALSGAGRIYLKKYGDCRLEDAGDCFSLAGCYKLAAEAYGRGNYFAKCLSMCTSINRNDLALHFIQSRSPHVTPDIDMEVTEHDFLKKCALHYHELGDNKTMLKVVKFFKSMDSKRSFLKTLNCFDELLALEKESGNFMEAVAVAKLKGDILLEADLLEKVGHYKDASLLVLFYVFSNSLWASGNKGWPLYPIKRRERLLTKAKLSAEKDSNVFYEIVCTEASILLSKFSSFAEMKQYFCDSQRQENLRGIILSAWKILKYSEERISQSWVYIETLFCFWDIWKEKIVNVIEYLGCLKSQDVDENTILGEFCLNYFGVRKVFIDDDILYLLLIQDAEWAVRVGDGLILQQKGESVSVDARQFVSAAKTYWCSEVLSLSLKVLGTLKGLFSSTVMTSLPTSCQTETAVNIFKITSFLTQCKFLESCISGETLQSISDTGLQYILLLENATLDVGVVDGNQELGQTIDGFLVKCALHYHACEDKRTMMKFVRAFRSLDSKRTILETLECFDELLLLEEEVGNYIEAATIAKLKGDLLLEADLLAKAGNHKDASMLILFYVFSNSLWADGSKGLPLKRFKDKGKLLMKAKSFAEKDSVVFYKFVCTEANILSNQPQYLSEMNKYLEAFCTQMNLRGVILSAWKILDTHFQLNPSKYEWESELVTDPIRHSEDMVSKNRASVETLIYFWDFWKEKILEIFEHLRCLEAQGVIENTKCEDFLLSYMGVRKEYHISNYIYILLNSEAEWVREIANGSVKRHGKLVSISLIQFVSAARRYWCSEVLTNGAKVLKTLNDLHMFSVKKSLSMFCQSMTSLHFFEVAKFLMETEFLESSSNELLQNICNMRLLFIQYCRQHVAPDVLTVNRNEEINEIEHVFLEKYALHHHKLEDNRTMMKLVQAFHSLESKRAFLRTLNCFDELLLLEEELGNFIEAASIARQKGDFVLEVDLLQKGSHFKDAAILILSHVLASSLWAPQSKGWPLKQFVQKEELSIKAKSLACKESDVFYEFVCTEINVLSDRESSLSKLEEYFNASQSNNSIVGEILSARKILDAHLNSDTSQYEWKDELTIDPMEHSTERISKERVSIETLIYFWNFWRDKITNVFEYLWCIEAQDVPRYSSYEDFCLSYLGVRKLFDKQNSIYLLLDPGADWARRNDGGSLQMVSLDGQQFVAAARSYWSAEVLSVGIKVLEILSSLHTFSLWNSFSLFRQNTSLLHIFDVTKFLMGSEFLERSRYDRILRNFSELSTRHIFQNLFPLDWCNALSENMMILRGTQIFKNVLEEIILEVINSGCELTYGQIGRVVMIMFGSGKLSTAVYEMVAERFDVNPSWKAFIRNFKGLMGSKFSDGYSTEGILVLKLHDALSDAFKIDWRQEVDYMSPNCFLYLVDRFLFLESYNQECLFTTKSSFIEWLICQELETSPSTRSVTEMKSSVTGAFDFLACIVNQLLVNKFNTMEWIKRSNLNLKYYTHLVLRLVVIICLLCLNSGKYFDVLQNLIGSTDISSQLPLDFFDFLQGREKLDFDFLVNVFGKALAKIGNPLVTVSLENGQKFSCPEAISVGRNDIQSRERLLKKLFREEVSDIQQGHGSAPEVCYINF